MTPIRYSANGGFNDTHLYVKYPDFPGARPQGHVTAQQYATARRETEQGLQMPRPGPINFAALAPALASATASTEQTNVRDRKTASAQRTLTGRMGVQDASGVVRESARQTATKGESSTSHSRGERSKLSGGRW